ncbi:MAG: protease modulator HflC, partial [Anaerolineae bacterium]|nr:protease modulator HflC [Anaerolineae bacterium]
VALGVVLVLVSSAFFTVDEKNQVIIQQLGRFVRSVREPGL